MNSTQCNGLLDLFLLCKLATEVWKDQAPINQHNGSGFKELSDVKTLADQLLEDGVAEHRIVNVLSTHLPPAVFKRHFPEVA